MHNWTKLDEYRIFYEHELNFYVIKPNKSKKPIPFECPVCELIQKDPDDAYFFKKYECCYSCATKWAESKKTDWEGGWRPTKEEIKKEKQRRLSLPIKIKIV